MRHMLAMISATVCVVAAIGGPARATAPMTAWNFDPAWPTTPPAMGFTGFTDFDVILPGDQTGVATGNYNSFVDPTSTSTYNSMTDQTTITFTSSSMSTIGLGGVSGSFGPSGPPTPHFGFSGDVPGATTGGEMIPPVSMEWSYGTSQTMAVPGLGVDFKSGSTGVTQYLIEYVTVTFGDLSTGEWFELPFQGGYKSSFVGSTGFDVTLSDAVFFVSPTEIPLDNLNTNDYPPTSPFFQPIPGIPDGTELMSGGSIAGPSVPEPATWVMMVLGFLGLGFAGRRLAWDRLQARA